MSLVKARANCYKCKGDVIKCHPHRCPMRIKSFALNQVKSTFKDKLNLEGDNPPSFFVGSFNWPNITISPMMNLFPYQSEIVDEPDFWKTQFEIPEIVKFRTNLIRVQGERVDARQVEELNNRLLETSQELVLSNNPVHTTFNLRKPINYSLNFNNYTQPIGPKGKLESFTVEDTPKIDPKVDYYTSDTDLKASEGITNLFNLDLSLTRINRILSAGLLGVKGQRRLVPTRWAITATDDTVGKKLIEEIKDYPEIDDFRVFSSSYLDNHFITFMLPKQWSYEFLEGWGENTITGDFETYRGRTNYASNSAGGYYASRIAVLEYLSKIKRQAEVYCWRYIGEGYYVPLGVWQVRENVRSGLNGQYKSFNDKLSMLTFVGALLQLNLNLWKKKSYLMNLKERQTKLSDYWHA